MNATTGLGSPFSGDYERVVKSTRSVSPLVMIVMLIMLALFGIGAVGYVGYKALSWTMTKVFDRPSLLKDPSGQIVGIMEADGTRISSKDQRFAVRRAEIGDSYEIMHVGWSD